jgi:hypothetical protein
VDKVDDEGGEFFTISLAAMRIGAALVLLAAAVASGRLGGLFRQYEYEEEMYLSLDGSATVYVNSSVAALDALRGAAFDPDPIARLDLAAVRKYYTTPVTRVVRVSTSRRNNRRFVHVRLEVDDVTRLGEARPFAWSSYRFSKDGDLVVYRQTVGAPADKTVQAVRWNGDEIVAFRLHLPSRVVYHSTGQEQRGNILVWEQTLADRMRGDPLTLDIRMESQSILNRTLRLFASTVAAVAVTFGLVIWWLVRRAGRPGIPGSREL